MRKNIFVIIMCTALIAIIGQSAVFAKNAEKEGVTDYFVVPYSKNNNDMVSDGSINNPFNGLHDAVEKLKIITKNGMNGDIVVNLRGGKYILEKTLVFNQEDSGKNGHTITYKSAEGESAEIYGAKTADIWSKSTDGTYIAKIGYEFTPQIVFENDMFGIKARYPNLNGEYRECYLKSNGFNSDNTRQFYFKSEDLKYSEDQDGMQVCFFAGGNTGVVNWQMQIFNALNINFRKREITLPQNPYMSMGAGSRFFLQGARRFLDADGEFIYNEKDGTLCYKPYNNDINHADIRFGVLTTLIQINGEKDKKAENIYFENLKIGKTNACEQVSTTKNIGAIEMNNAVNCGVKNCEILLTGSVGIRIMGDSLKCEVKNNYIHDIGDVAVALEGYKNLAVIANGYHEITNNKIVHIGRIVRHASAITVGNSDANKITHNYIADVPRAGINLGGSIDSGIVGSTIGQTLVNKNNRYEFMNCKENYVAFNDISNCMTDTQDCGVIYTSMTGVGNVIENNYLHNSQIYFSTGYGLYLDDGSSNYKIRNNIVADLQHEGKGLLSGVQMIKSRKNELINNFYVDNRSDKCAIATEAKVADNHDEIIFEKNIVSDCGRNLHGQFRWNNDRFKKCDNNLYYNSKGMYFMYNNDKAKDITEWKNIVTDWGKLDEHSIIDEYPGFVNEDNQDYRLRYDSPAYSIGIADINMKDIGLSENFPFTEKDDEIDRLYVISDTNDYQANIRIQKGDISKISVYARTLGGYLYKLQSEDFVVNNENADIVDINDNKITALKEGIGKIRIVTNDLNHYVDLFVIIGDSISEIQTDVSQISIDKGQSDKINASLKTEFGLYVPATFEYKSSNKEIAAVDSEGNILSKNPGKCKVTITSKSNGKVISKDVMVNVIDGVIAKLDAKAETVDGLLRGEQSKITLSITLSNDKEILPSECSITYESVDENVMTVDSNGTMTACNPGRTEIIIRAEKDGYAKETSIAVSVFEKRLGTLPEGFKEMNFGTSHGFADLKDNSIFIKSTGDNYWGTVDDGYMLYKPIQTDGEVVLEGQIMSLLNTNNNAAVGLTFRDGIEADGAHFTVRMAANTDLFCIWRDSKSANTQAYWVKKAKWGTYIRIVKNKNTFTVYISEDGKDYTNIYQQTVSINNCVAGISQFSQNIMSTESEISGFRIIEN